MRKIATDIFVAHIMAFLVDGGKYCAHWTVGILENLAGRDAWYGAWIRDVDIGSAVGLALPRGACRLTPHKMPAALS